jgi:hypothetical protein
MILIVVVVDDYFDENIRNFDLVLKVVVDHYEMVMIVMAYQQNENQILVQLDHLHFLKSHVLYQ